jgi:uncharacterized ion transporter superfamily protein YfcC
MTDSNKVQKRAFLSAIIILLVLLITTGILTFFIPSGSFQRELIEGTEMIIPDSFQYTNQDNIQIFRIFTAPIEVLFSDGSAIIIAIIAFLLIIGGSINILNKIGIIEHIIHNIVKRFYNSKYLLLSLITLMFMLVGALVGVFEEIIPLVPIMIILSKKLGWDTKIGLGMSILAAGFGFSAAITNPFTIGVAQEISNLPIFSGILYRFIIFIVIYIVLITFLIINAKRIDAKPSYDEMIMNYNKPNKKSIIWTSIWLGLMVISIVLSPFIPFLQDFNLILIALYFLIAGLGAGLLSKTFKRETPSIFLKGALAMAPGVILILLATGVKHLITISGVMDTILFTLTETIGGSSNFVVISGSFLFTLVLNFFVGSGSAKAFLIMPIMNPLLDFAGISRQLGVLAFQLGDGFSNMFYPTNAVLLVALGLGNFSYGKWFKWTLILQAIVILLSILFLFIGLKVGY